MDAKGARQFGSDDRTVTLEIQLAGDDELRKIAHLEFQGRIDTTNFGGESLMIKLNNDRPLHKRGGGHHPGRFF